MKEPLVFNKVAGSSVKNGNTQALFNIPTFYTSIEMFLEYLRVLFSDYYPGISLKFFACSTRLYSYAHDNPFSVVDAFQLYTSVQL